MLTEPSGEKLKVNVPLLNNKDLIKKNGGVPPWINPREIPVHPLVHQSDFAYTPEFLRDVVLATAPALIDDIKTLEEILGINLNTQVTAQGVTRGGRQLFSFEQIRKAANPVKHKVELGLGGSNLGLNREPTPGYAQELFVPRSNYPMPVEKTKIYLLDPNDPYSGMYAWYTHTLSEGAGGIPFELYCRNFAIVFNNLGLKKLDLA